MAHDPSIRFRCRALFEIMNMSLTEISKQELVGLSTLSDWKNDGREELGGIWLQGCKAGDIEKTAIKLREELQATSIYDDIKNKLTKYNGISKDGGLEVDGIISLSSDNKELQAKVEADVVMLAVVGADWLDSQMLKNSMLSSIVLNNQVKRDITKVKQSDIKASSEIHKIAKESRFGKSPETVIFNTNGKYTPEELDGLSIEQLEQLARKELEIIEVPVSEKNEA